MMAHVPRSVSHAGLLTALAALAIPALVATGLVAATPAAASEAPSRIVSIGGAITEILFDLGAADRLAAVDTTSTFPAAARDLPSVGYMRALSAEGVLSVAPDLVLAQDGAGPPPVMAILKAGAVPMTLVPDTPTPEGVAQKIRMVGAAVGAKDRAESLAGAVTADFAALAGEVASISERKRVLFVLSLAGGRPMVGGTDTAADAIITLAGGVNAASGFSGYKPMVDEAVIAAAPDVVLVMAREGHDVDAATLFAQPAFAVTPAAATRALVTMEGLYLLGFGPRAPAAARDLAARLYPGRIAAP